MSTINKADITDKMDTMSPANIGNNIRLLRTADGMTQEQLAGELGVSYQAISKWETNANTPDIQLLPQLAKVFGVSIDALFSENAPECRLAPEFVRDDDVFRVLQFRGRKLVRVDRTISRDCPPIEIAFPKNCNNATQYFKVEVYGHVISDGSINGDVVAHGGVECGEVNGNLKCSGDVRASTVYGRVECGGDLNAGTITTSADISCRDILECYKINCRDITCARAEVGTLCCAKLTTE